MILTGCPDGLKIVIHRKVVSQHFRIRPAVVEKTPFLTKENRHFADASGKSTRHFGPVECLTASQRHSEIKLGTLERA